MISQESIAEYRGVSLNRGVSFLYIPPHALLRSYISNYTVSFPTPLSMPDAYTILPTASSTLVISVTDNGIYSGLRGVNTKACTVGSYANKMKLLLLIEFRPGCLYPFLPIDQATLADASLALADVDRTLTRALADTLMQSERLDTLIDALDSVFIHRLMARHTNEGIWPFMQSIIGRHGNISARELAAAFYYSEKHMRRLFLRHVGAGPKTFSRIVRVNYALRLLQQEPRRLTDVAAQAGFFDQPHLIHDFKAICGLTPQAYTQNMSVYYNDASKL